MCLLNLVLAGLIATAGSALARAEFSLAGQAATQKISQGLQAGNAGAVTAAVNGDVEGSAATESVGMGGTKYIPAYAIVLMFVGLSTFVACRPSRRHSAD